MGQSTGGTLIERFEAAARNGPFLYHATRVVLTARPFLPPEGHPAGGASMINTAVESTQPLAKAARKHTSSRGEGGIHPTTLHRWRLTGIGGITLECIRVGGVWHTSQEALQRFFERVTAAHSGVGRVDAPRLRSAGRGVPPNATAATSVSRPNLKRH